MGRIYLVPVKLLYDSTERHRIGMRMASVYVEFLKELQDVKMTKAAIRLFGNKAPSLWYGVEKPKVGIKYARLEAMQDYTWKQLEELGACCMQLRYDEQCIVFPLGTLIENSNMSTCDIPPIILAGDTAIPSYSLNDISAVGYVEKLGHVYLLNGEGAFLELEGQPYAERCKRWSRKTPVILKVADSRIATSAAASEAWKNKLATDYEAQATLFAYSKCKSASTHDWCVSTGYIPKVNAIPLNCVQQEGFVKEAQVHNLMGEGVYYTNCNIITYVVDLDTIENPPAVLTIPQNIEEYFVRAQTRTDCVLPRLYSQTPIGWLNIRNCVKVAASSCSKGFSKYTVDNSALEQGSYVADVPSELNATLKQPTYIVSTRTFIPPKNTWLLSELFTEDTRTVLDTFRLAIANPISQSAIMIPAAHNNMIFCVYDTAPSMLLCIDTRAIKKIKEADINVMMSYNGTLVLNLQGAHIRQLTVSISLFAEEIKQGRGTVQRVHIMNGTVTSLRVETNVIIQQLQVDISCKRVGITGWQRNIYNDAFHRVAHSYNYYRYGNHNQTVSMCATVKEVQITRAEELCLHHLYDTTVNVEVAPKTLGVIDTKYVIHAIKGTIPPATKT